MKTIDKILKANNITRVELNKMEKEGKVNGIGGQGANYDKYIKYYIETLYGFDIKRADELYSNIRTLALIHDKMYYYQEGFYKSNFILSYNLFKLTHWTKLWARLSLSIGVFIITTIVGKKYYLNNK